MLSLSIVVIAYNSRDVISDCLNSIFLQKEDNVEIIVVDNGSSDKTVSIVRDKFPDAVVIGNEKNWGYSKAANQGIRGTKGEYILILNSDITLEQNFIKKLNIQIDYLPSYVGMVSPKIMCTDKIIDSAGLHLSQLRRLYDRGREHKDGRQFNLPTYIFGPCGACAIYKREMLEDIKLDGEYFDEDFFILAEDFDIAWRANLLGWKGWFMPEIRCFHRGGISRSRSEFTQYYAFRNRYFLLIKNESELGLLKLFLFVWVYDLPRLVYLLFTNNYTLKAFREIKQLLPTMIKKRHSIKRKKREILRK